MACSPPWTPGGAAGSADLKGRPCSCTTTAATTTCTPSSCAASAGRTSTSARSRPGRGRAPPGGEAAETARDRAPGQPCFTARVPATVLIVDDDPDMRVLLRTAIEYDERFVVVDEAKDGLVAIAQAATHHPDIVLLDAAMPELDGIAAIPGIRAVSKGSQVFVYSAYLGDESEQLALANGAVAVVSKRMPIKELLDLA